MIGLKLFKYRLERYISPISMLFQILKYIVELSIPEPLVFRIFNSMHFYIISL